MRWQIKTTLLVAAVAPPTAGILLQVLSYLPQWYRGTSEFNQVSSFIFTAIGVTIPVSYIFGLIPAVIGGAAYCAILTYLPTLRRNRWLRSAAAAIMGALTGAVFGHFFSGTPGMFALLGAMVSTIVASFTPRSTHGAA